MTDPISILLFTYVVGSWSAFIAALTEKNPRISLGPKLFIVFLWPLMILIIGLEMMFNWLERVFDG